MTDRSLPTLAGPGASGRERAIGLAASAVLEDRDAWGPHALSVEEADVALKRLVGFLEEGGTDAAAMERRDDALRSSALSLRMAELLRRELLRDGRGLHAEETLDIIRGIEEFRKGLEPRSRQELTYLFTGADALHLVVEFAHDLRSPLTSIMFLSETLRKGQSGRINDVQREQLAIVYSAALGMVGVANDVMDLARLETDARPSDFGEETFSLEQLVETVRNTVAPMAEQKGLKIAYLTSSHDLRSGHPILLSRVLLNLLTNAIKFTDSGRVELVAEDVSERRMQFSVQDTGRGMGQEEIEQLYTLFVRSESRTGYHFSGTGLGLAICKRMIEIMGGELRVESRRGSGTRFWFELDLPRE